MGAQKNRQWGNSFESPQHMFGLRNKKNDSLLRTGLWIIILFTALTLIYYEFDILLLNKPVFLKKEPMIKTNLLALEGVFSCDITMTHILVLESKGV